MDEKTKELVALGAAVGAHCQPCLTYHVAKARELGIGEEEIQEAIVVGHQVEMGAVKAMRQFTGEVFSAPPGNAMGVAGQVTLKQPCYSTGQVRTEP